MKALHIAVTATLLAVLLLVGRTSAQTSPKSIEVLPAKPLVSPGQTQFFIAASVNPTTFGQVSTIATGGWHTCALMPDSTVQCWGYNNGGQLGNGTTVSSDVPVTVSGLTGAVAVSAGSFHSCALLANGTVQCWGKNGFGQLGNGNNNNSYIPVTVSGLSGVIAIAAGYDGTCAVIVGGNVECWGRNTNSNLPTSVTSPLGDNLEGAIAIAASAGPLSDEGISGHTCILVFDGTVDCWGDNTYGQLGGVPASPGQAVAVSGLSGAVAIAAGTVHTCALISDGTVQCWGLNFQEQLGNGTNVDSPSPVTVAGLSGRAIAIAAGGGQSCALIDNGTVQCWGADTSGELGDGVVTTTLTPGVNPPVTVSGLSNATAIFAANDHTCALLVSGTADCWGGNIEGQLGNGSTTESDVPVAVLINDLSAQGAIRVASQFSINTCALLASGTAECWGDDQSDGLGNDATTLEIPSPVAMTVVSEMKAVNNGAFGTCVLLANGTVQCWGGNGHGEVGNGTTTDSITPQTVSNLSGVKAISLGYQFACALLSSGTVECWGENDLGELGNGSFTDSSVPTVVTGPPFAVGGLSNVKAISAGLDHVCALLANGTVQCWGYNYDGELGNGSYNSTPPYGIPEPAAVPNLPGITVIDSGGASTCALHVSGGLLCWGDDNFGELGDGTNHTSASPVSVLSYTGYKALALGETHACALAADGTAQCWGNNSDGELGNGTNAQFNTPVAVTGLSGLMGLTAGYAHSCGLLSNGTVECWGWNGFGQLGNGTTTESDTPVPTFGLVPSVIWTSSEPDVAAINSGSGLAQAIADGTTTITAVYGAKTAHTTMTVGTAPAITSPSAASFTTGTPGSFTITATGSAPLKFTKSGNLPKGVTFVDNGNGTASISGTPAPKTGGTYTLTITAKNGLGTNATQTFTLTVDQPPAITSAANSTFTVGTAKSFTVVMSGFPAPTLSYSGSLPGGITLNTASGVLSGTATPGTGGTYPLVLTASSGDDANATQNFVLTVDESPTITSSNAATFPVGTLSFFTVTTTGFPVPKLSKTGTLPKGVTFVDNGNGTGTLSGGPAPNTTGTYTITITAKNSAGSSTESFTLTVH